METQLETQNVIPRKLAEMVTAGANSFTKALEILMSNETGKKGITFDGPYLLNEEEKNSLKLLPEAFSLDKTKQSLKFRNVNVDDILVAEALRAGLKKNKITFIQFYNCNIVRSQNLVETLCEGFKERSTVFQLELWTCSSEFVKPILEASHLKCFSLRLWNMDCTGIDRSLRNLCYKGSLYYISLGYLKGLKEDVFIQLGRCLIPNLTIFSLEGTEVPVSALKHLIGSLKKNLDSGRSNVFEILDLGSQVIGSRLSFACFQLLGSDLVDFFELTVKEDISRAVVKSICSTVEKTNNLKNLYPGTNFSSGTKFNNFTLQEESIGFNSPFGVNPTDL